MNPSEVTLVIPCYNTADTLRWTLEAVERLSPRPTEVICIDDGSTDGTKSLIDGWDGIECIEHPENRGLAATLNTALDHTTTRGFAKLDADLTVESDWLGRLCDFLENRDADLVHGKLLEQVTTLGDKWRERHPSPIFPDKPVCGRTINGSNILAKTEALRAVNGWNEKYVRAFDDIDLFERLLAEDRQVCYSPNVVATHRRTDNWQQALEVAWAYHYDSLNGRHPPANAIDILRRIPGLASSALSSVRDDLRRGDLDILWISFLRFFFHLRWDINHVRRS